MTHSHRSPVFPAVPVPPASANAGGRTTRPERSWNGTASVLALTALLVYLALTPLPPFARDPYGSLTRRYIIVGAVLAGYLLLLVLRRGLPGRTPLDLPLAAIALSLVIAIVRAAAPRVSLEAVLPLLPAFGFLYLLHDARSLTARRLALALVGAAALVAAVALLSVWETLDRWWTFVRAVEGDIGLDTVLPPATPRIADTGNHPNILGTLFAMALPAALLGWSGSRSRLERTLIAAAVGLIVAGLFFTLSRAAWGGAAAGLLVAAVGFGGARPGWWPSRRLLTILAGACAVGLLLFLLLVTSDARPDWLFRDSLGPRADLRRAGVELWRDNPLTGVGPGLFTALYPLYGGAYPFAAVHTHNIIVQTLVDTGLAGLIAGGWLVLTVLALLATGYWHGTPGQRRSLAAAAGMLTAFGVHALADSPQLFPETGLAAVVALVMLLRSVDGALLPSRWLPRSFRDPAAGLARVVPAALVLGLVAGLLPLWAWSSRAHAAYDQSIRHARAERWPESVAAAQQAVERDDRMPAYWFQLGAAHASAAIAGDRRREQEAALYALQRGLELEPHNGAALTNYAALGVALDRPEMARESLPALGQLAGRDSLLLLAQATLTQWTAPPERAIESYAGLLVLNPALAGTPFWEDGGFRAANFERIVDRALARVAEVAGETPATESLRTAILVYAGRETPSADALLTALAARPDDVGLRVATGRLLLADGNPESRSRAFALLDGAVRLRGDDPGARAALGDYYAAAGDMERARRQWLAAAHLGDLGATVALGESYRPGPVPPVVVKRAETLLAAAELERFYLIFQTYRFTFQRAEAIPIILPGDWLTALSSELPRWRTVIEGWQP